MSSSEGAFSGKTFPGKIFQKGFSRNDFPGRLSMKVFPDILFSEEFSRKYCNSNAFPAIPHEECNAALCVSQL